jgi:hypothetical protein
VAEIVALSEGVASLVRDGDAVALEGFTDLVVTAEPTGRERSALEELVARG